jgi:hypothetical protein
MQNDSDLRQDLQGLRQSMEAIVTAVEQIAERQSAMEALLVQMLDALMPEEEAEESDLRSLFGKMLQALDQQSKTLTTLVALQSGIGKTIEEAVIRGAGRAREGWSK